ncbi:hypothetical protein DCO49_05450 [Stenotrophomonas sp. SPM]|jgi:hypothetical protein|uniref:hypothetical protein n=1 Tax=unclassified Stenotrophomonas TaxID=196198 RepID=UPI000DE63B0A|nr:MULTISPECIES: hypothetical protein [unclassified Stenotrophomonas]PWB28492.1 hypothetical protein DCO49_05450 [Stenotrophomonas sp. SPM]
MQCTIPVSLFNRSMLFQELAPAAVLFICAIGLAFHGGLEPRKKLFAIAILCVVGSATSASTAMLALRSKIDINGGTATLHAGFWKAELPTPALVGAGATEQVSDSLRKRKNGMSSGGVNAGWFEDPNGKRVFALSAGRTPVLLTTSSGFSLVLDQSTADAITECIRSESSR